MEGRRSDAAITVDPPGRQRFFDSSGVGRPRKDGGVVLTWVEAAYLLARGDLDTVDGVDTATFLGRPPDHHALDRWLVYRDLRERGYYASPAYAPGDPPSPGEETFVVRPRGDAPTSDAVAYRIGVVPEAAPLALGDLSSLTLAVADDEGELTYLGVEAFDPTGTTDIGDWSRAEGVACGRRVLVSSPPAGMGDPALFGRELDGDRLLNALEARYLFENGRLSVDDAHFDTDPRRYVAYSALRDRGCVPRSGLKFGADFRVYTDVASANDPGHSSFLVEVVDHDADVTARTLSRAVRLAGGVRKRHVFALVDGDAIDWVALKRRRL